MLAAVITGAHGVTGNVRLRLIGENAQLTAQSLQGSGTVWVCPPSGDTPGRFLTLRSLRKQTQPKGAWIAQWREITHRLDAEALYGWELRIREAARAALPPGEYYVDDLLGLAVQTDTGANLGTLADVLHSPANDVYEMDTGHFGACRAGVHYPRGQGGGRDYRAGRARPAGLKHCAGLQPL